MLCREPMIGGEEMGLKFMMHWPRHVEWAGCKIKSNAELSQPPLDCTILISQIKANVNRSIFRQLAHPPNPHPILSFLHARIFAQPRWQYIANNKYCVLTPQVNQQNMNSIDNWQYMFADLPSFMTINTYKLEKQTATSLSADGRMTWRADKFLQNKPWDNKTSYPSHPTLSIWRWEF